MNVFVSYARETLAVAEAIVAGLERAGHDVWFDRELLAHRSYTDAIEEALNGADAALVLWSTSAVASEWVRSEANRARETGKLVQVRLDDCRLPMPFDQVHCIDLLPSSEFEASPAWRSVLESLRGVKSEAAAPSDIVPKPEPAATHRPGRERRQVTALACVLEVNVSPGAVVDPEDLLDLASDFRRTTDATLLEAGGVVLEHDRSSALGVFGYPTTHEEEVVLAASAGRALLSRLSELEAPSGCVLAVRVGLATGPAVIERRDAVDDFEVIGAPLELSRTLVQAARPDTLLAAGESVAIATGMLELAAPANEELAAAQDPAAREVLGLTEAASRSGARIVTDDLELVGREQESAALAESWASAKEGFGQVVLVQGESGIGKSSLVSAGLRVPRAEADLNVALQCGYRSSARALYPFRRWLAAHAGFERSDDAEARTAKLAALLGEPSELQAQQLEVLSGFLGLAAPATATLTQSWTAEQKLSLLIETLHALVLAGDEVCVLVVVEDLHWADPTTVEFLDRLVEASPDRRCMIVGTTRPEYTPSWSELTDAIVLPVDRLKPGDAAHIAERVAGAGVLAPGIVEMIVDRSDGIPLYVEEITRSVLASAPSLRDSEANIPATLQDALTARLDRLGSAREVFSVGALIGREFSYDVLAELLDLSLPELREALRLLVKERLLQREGVPPKSRYRFRHALLRETAAQAMPERRQRELHRRIVDALRQVDPQIDAREPEVLAHHLGRTRGDVLEAIELWVLAGERGAAAAHHREAIQCFESARALLPASGDDPALARARLSVLTGLAVSLAVVESYASPAVKAVLAEARETGALAGSEEQLFKVVRGMCAASIISGDLAGAEALARNCLELGESTGIVDHLIEGHCPFGYVSWVCGRPLATAREHLERCIDLYSEQGGMRSGLLTPMDPLVQSLGPLYLVHLASGDDAALAAVRERFLALVDSLEPGFDLASALLWCGFCELMARQLESALTLLQRCSAVCDEQGIVSLAPYAQINLGLVRGLLRRSDEDVAPVRQLLAVLEQAGYLHLHCAYRGELASVYLQRGEADQALAEVEAALRIAGEQGEGYWLPRLRLRAAEIMRARSGSDSTAIRSALLEARQLAETQGAERYAGQARRLLEELPAQGH